MIFIVDGYTFNTDNIWKVSPVYRGKNRSNYYFEIIGLNDNDHKFRLNVIRYGCDNNFDAWLMKDEDERDKIRKITRERMEEVRQRVIDQWKSAKQSDIPLIKLME